VRSRAAPGMSRCRPALPSLRSDGTSPGSLSWLYESPAAPDLPLMIPELPANQGVVCWRARFTDSHSSLVLVLSSMSGHTRDKNQLALCTHIPPSLSHPHSLSHPGLPVPPRVPHPPAPPSILPDPQAFAYLKAWVRELRKASTELGISCGRHSVRRRVMYN
jgi:hypothetical protein